MDELANSEELSFIPEQVEPILYKAIEDVLASKANPVSYDEALVKQWIDTICDKCMHGLNEMQKPYKYIVTCTIMQRNGAGIHTAHSCYWNVVDDNVAQVYWPNDKKRDTNNARLICMITAVGMML